MPLKMGATAAPLPFPPSPFKLFFLFFLSASLFLFFDFFLKIGLGGVAISLFRTLQVTGAKILVRGNAMEVAVTVVNFAVVILPM